ncbi:hypothetical protein [Algibacillus agarilyticus]|uniref:hypothetical protein n=1 Tax=Algibacillus agarilyticus TaxID=2234133 RepID=UPI001E5762E5|nr:hypothetical protein [Algibacillus agarilyticus]
MPVFKWLIMFLPVFVLLGCGDPLQAKIETQIELVDMQIKKLSQRLSDGQVRNANLIRDYASQLQILRPELKTITQELAKDSGLKGPLYTNLVDRFQVAKHNPAAFSVPEERLHELENLYQAASPELFNDVLSDPLNVLADLSEGKLARVNAISREASIKANGAADFGAGSQLVGNPAYGNWRTDNSGMSFWEWYGMYALISNVGDMFDSRRRIHYSDWSSRRDYSYYHDYGRYRYSSPGQIKKQVQTEQRVAKNYRGKGQFKSAYATSKTGASRVSSSSLTSQRAAKSFQSAYAKPSTYKSTAPSTKSTSTYKSTTSQKSSNFANNSSFRSSKSSSRGGFGGK